MPEQPAPPILLVIGIHREELAYGRAVAAGLDPARTEVLEIPDGLSGVRPRPDQRFRYDTLHQALYRQLLAHIRPGHRILLDLHTGQDETGPCSDLYCHERGRLKGVLARAILPAPAPRLFALGHCTDGHCAETIIPPTLWRNSHFLYVGMEIYLPAPGNIGMGDVAYGRGLVQALDQDPVGLAAAF